jgi:hypothetical protein
MDPFSIAGLVLGGVSVISSIVGGNKARHAAEDQAKEEARLEGLVTGEKIRKLGLEETQLRGATIAAVAGSGVKTDVGSPLMVLAEQAAEFKREKSIIEKVGASRAAAALTHGSNIGKQAQYQGYSQAASSLSNLFQIIAANKAPGTE